MPSDSVINAECPNINESVRPKWSHIEYRWRLENFWELRALACVEALGDDGGLIWSQKFGDKERGLWQLKLYPYGDLSGAGIGHVSLFLSLDLKSLETPRAYAIFGCYLLDENGQKVPDSGRSFTRQKFAEGSSSWGWSQFIKVEGHSLHELLTRTSNALVVKCEIEVFVGILALPGRSLPQPKTWEEEMKAYMNDRRLHNISLICEDRIIRANKHILCARSKWFERRLGRMGGEGPHTAVSSARVDDDPFSSGMVDTRNDTQKVIPHSSMVYSSFGASDFDNSLNSTTESASNPPHQSLDGYTANPLIDVLPNGKIMARQQNESNLRQVVSDPTTSGGTLEISEVSVLVLENIVAFMNTDDCRYFTDETSLKNLLELLVGSKKLEVDALFHTLVRKLCLFVVSKPAAFAIQEVAESVGASELSDQCAKYLLMCVRELSDSEVLKAITPSKR